MWKKKSTVKAPATRAENGKALCKRKMMYK